MAMLNSTAAKERVARVAASMKQRLTWSSFTMLLWGGIALATIIRILMGLLGKSTITSSVLASFVCVACLFAYYFLNRHSRNERHPDNLYYMGLLFTLSSLVYSLITLFVLSPTGEMDERIHNLMDERIHNLIGSFGIALISTFVGIWLRILMLQREQNVDDATYPGGVTSPHSDATYPGGVTSPHSDATYPKGATPPPVIRSADAELTETAFQLRMVLTQTIADMNVFRKSIQQACNETVTSTQNMHAEVLQQIQDAYAPLTQFVDAQAARAKQALETTTRSTGEMEQKLRELVTSMVGGGEQLTKTLRDVADNLQTISRNAEAIFADHERASAGLKNIAATLVDCEKDMAESTKTLARSTKNLAASFATAAESAPMHTEKLAQWADEIEGEAAKWIQMTTKVRETLAKSLDKLSDAIKRK